MSALASTADVESRYPGEMSADNLARLPALLDDASAVVRSYTRQQFTTATTTERIRPIGQTVKLPQKPVTAVNTVSLVDTLQSGNLLALPLGAWMWDGGQEVWIGGANVVINLPDDVSQLLQYQVPLVEVNYTHGYTTVPAEVVAVVCSMVIRFVDVPGPTGMQSQTVGPYGYRLSTTAQEGILSLTASEMRVLAPYRRSATTVELR